MPPFSSQPCGTPNLLYPGRPSLDVCVPIETAVFPADNLSFPSQDPVTCNHVHPTPKAESVPKGKMSINYQDSRCDPAAGNGQSLADTSLMMTCHSSAVSASASTRMLRCEGNSLCGRHLGLPGAAADPLPQG